MVKSILQITYVDIWIIPFNLIYGHMVTCFGFTLKNPKRTLRSLPVWRTYEWPCIASILFCRVTRYSLRNSSRYSLTWNTQNLRQSSFRSVWCWHQGTGAVEWILEAPVKCSTIAEMCLTCCALFFPLFGSCCLCGELQTCINRVKWLSHKSKRQRRISQGVCSVLSHQGYE